MDTQNTVSVTSILGVTREARLYPDGGWNCPFCSGAVSPDDPEVNGRRCGNPVCDAGRYATEERAIQHREERERRITNQAALRAVSAAQQDARTREVAAAERRRAEVLAEAREQGYCTVCITQYRPKRVRHRTPDFHSKRPGRW